MNDPVIVDKGLVRWRSRRGMKELDLFFIMFVDHAYDALTPEEKITYSNLLNEEDQDLWRWLLKLDQPAFKYDYLINEIQKVYVLHQSL